MNRHKSCKYIFFISLVLFLTVNLGVAFAAYQDEVLADNPVAYYRFEETSGTTAADSSVNSNSGTYSGATLPTLNQTGLSTLGVCAEFDGSGFVITPNTVGAYDDFTLEAWINFSGSSPLGPEAYNGWGVINSDVGNDADDFVLGIADNRPAFFTGSIGYAVDRQVNGTTPLNNGVWHHIVVTRDNCGMIQVYVDGSFQAETLSPNCNRLDDNPWMYIGGYTGYSSFIGLIDEVAYYPTVLASDRIAAHYSAVFPCAFSSIDPTNKSVMVAGETDNTVTLTTGGSCDWTAAVDPAYTSWINITNGSSGTGSGTVTYTVLENDTGALRSGTITIAGETFRISQDVGFSAWGPNEIQKILASDGVADDQFGVSVAIDGDTAIVGAYMDDGIVSNSGAAYVFIRSGGVWTQQAKLLAVDGAADDNFGISVAIDGDTAIVGAYLVDDNDTIPPVLDIGAAYVFKRTAGVWAQQAKLLPEPWAVENRNHHFGWSVAIDGGTAVVGANNANLSRRSGIGAVYVFVESGATWTQQQKLQIFYSSPDDPVESGSFGNSVSISENTLIVGVPEDSRDTYNIGRAYVFTRTDGVWTPEATLLADDGADFDYFGWSVAIDGDTAVVGAYLDDESAVDSGSAYVFTRSDDVWTQETKLISVDSAANDQFGNSVAISGDNILVGAALNDDNGSASGSAYVFEKPVTGWTSASPLIESAKLMSSDGTADDSFGIAVAISGDTAMIGAYGDDDNGSASGSAYFFSDVFDFGDAPDPTYPTLLASNGARHAAAGPTLGSNCDTEADGQPATGADGDDTNGTPDDEDGVVFTSTLIPGASADVEVTASEPCTLSAWVDFNGDGDWADADEDIFPGGQALTAGVNSLSFSVPAGARTGNTFTRFRVTTDGPVTYTGLASDGEVEDYQVAVTTPPDTTYTITASAGGNGSISPSGVVSVNDGSDQAFTITPYANYHVADVLVDGSSVGVVTSYTFTNVTAAHTIAATFAINHTATISGDNTGNMTEDSSGDTGVMSVSDADPGHDVFQVQTNTAGTYGTFSINAAGNWTYTRTENLQSMNAGDMLNDSFNVASADGTDTETVTITIDGINDSATIGGDNAGNMTEDDNGDTGVMSVTDVDNGENVFQPQTNTAVTYGTFSINAAGNWTYTRTADLQSMNAGDLLNDSFNVSSADGTDTAAVNITITGVNDPPSSHLSGERTGYLTEDGTGDSDNISITDIDDGESFFQPQTNTAGTYGTFSLTALGNWTYTRTADLNWMNEGTQIAESFGVTSADGTTTPYYEVDITISGLKR